MKQREQYLSLGKSLLHKAFSEAGEAMTEKGLHDVLANFKQQSIDDLYAAVGAALVSARDVVHAVYPGLKSRAKGGADVVPIARARARLREGGEAAPDDPSIAVRGLIPGMAVHFARCCHPLPGDRIVGIITTGKGVTIHTIDCETLESFAHQPERWIDVGWQGAADSGNKYVGRLRVTVENRTGTLSSLSTVIARNEGNIINLKITNRSSDFFDMLLDIEVTDARHLADITAALRATPAINAVERARA
jgi:GTP pyrophosphokinase